MTQDSEFEAQVNALEPYSTAVINTHIATASETYSPGDMIVKNIDGTTSTIFAQRGGIFYPKTIKKTYLDDSNFSYDILFAFQSTAPKINSTSNVSGTDSTDDEDDKNDTWDASFAANLNFKNLSAGVPATPYNQAFVKTKGSDWSSHTYKNMSISGTTTKTMSIVIEADFIKKDDLDIEISPIIHCYADKEEIYMDQSVEYSSATKAFTVKMPVVELCTRVVVK